MEVKEDYSFYEFQNCKNHSESNASYFSFRAIYKFYKWKFHRTFLSTVEGVAIFQCNLHLLPQSLSISNQKWRLKETHYIVTAPSLGNSAVLWTVDDRVLYNTDSSQNLSILYSLAGSISCLASKRREKWV